MKSFSIDNFENISKRKRKIMFRVGLLLGFFLISGIEGTAVYVEDAFIQSSNGEFIDQEATHMEVVWANLTSSGIGLNLTLLKRLPETTRAHFDLYLKTMGEYRTHSGITANIPWCTAMTDPILVGSLVKALGIPDECPTPAGTYMTPYWQPSTELMPENFPGTDYKVEFVIKVGQNVIFEVWIYVSVF